MSGEMIRLSISLRLAVDFLKVMCINLSLYLTYCKQVGVPQYVT